METSFFYEVFSSLSNAEVRQYRHFVASPYFNGRMHLIPLLDFFIKKRQAGEVPTPEEAYPAAYPKEQFDVAKWRLSLSQLYKLAEQFLAQQQMEAEVNFPRLYTAQAYCNRNLVKHFQRTLTALEKEQAAVTERHAGYYEAQYQLEWERYRFLSQGKRTEEFNLQATTDLMDTAYVARKLRQVCFSMSHQAVYKKEYSLGLFEAVLEWVERNPHLLEIPAIGLYYHCYRTIYSSSDEERFELFKKMLFDKAHLLPEDERRNLFLLAINYGIRQLNASRPAYDRPVLDLYKVALEGNLLQAEGRISRFAYNNIAAIALRIGETDWAEQFIHQYKNSLEREYRHLTFSLNKARLEFARKNYQAALLSLQFSDYKDLINSMNAKVLQLKIYYLTGEHEALESHLVSMKTYVRRQRSFGYHKEIYLNIIRFTQALLALNPFDKREKAALRDRIASAEWLTEREWLLEMVDG